MGRSGGRPLDPVLSGGRKGRWGRSAPEEATEGAGAAGDGCRTVGGERGRRSRVREGGGNGGSGQTNRGRGGRRVEMKEDPVGGKGCSVMKDFTDGGGGGAIDRDPVVEGGDLGTASAPEEMTVNGRRTDGEAMSEVARGMVFGRRRGRRWRVASRREDRQRRRR